MCYSAGEWGAPGNSSQVSGRALKWTRFLRPGHWLHQDCPPVTGDALPANHQKWPRGTSHHTMSDSNTTSPCHCSQVAKNSQSETLQMPSEHVQKAAPLCWSGRNKTGVSNQRPPKERKKNGGYQHPDWPPRIKRRPWSLQQIVQRQEKANTPFDLQSFECDIVKSLSILLFLKYTKNIYYYWALKEKTCHIFSIESGQCA